MLNLHMVVDDSRQAVPIVDWPSFWFGAVAATLCFAALGVVAYFGPWVVL